jgi:threonine/homoserine/homoserine lactone efflux protein
MDILVIVGLVLALINPVIGGVFVGYFVWLKEPMVGLQLIILSFTMMSIYVIIFMVWAGRKLRKIEQRLQSLEHKG